MKKIFSAITHLSLAVLVVGGLSYVEAAWQAPVSAPVQDAVIDPPLNTGGVNQVKTGSIGASSVTAAYGMNVGIPGTVAAPGSAASLNIWPDTDSSAFRNNRIVFWGSNKQNNGGAVFMFSSQNTLVPTMIIDASINGAAGKVGIGTGLPTATSERLEVAGKVRADDFCLNAPQSSQCLSKKSSFDTYTPVTCSVGSGDRICSTGFSFTTHICLLSYAYQACDYAGEGVFVDPADNMWKISLHGASCKSTGGLSATAMCFSR